jgi:hypothetical protein
MKLSHSQNTALAEYNVPSAATENLAESTKFFPHDRILRTLGALLQQAGFTEYELRVNGAVYAILGQVAKQHSAPRSLLRRFFGFSGTGEQCQQPAVRQLQYSITDLLNCETESRERRQQSSLMPDPYSTSQILRGVGCFLDKREGSRLLGVTVKDRWVAIDYVTADGREQKETQDFEYFYNYWVKMYMQRSSRDKLPPPSDPTLYVTWESGRRQHRLSRIPN